MSTTTEWQTPSTPPLTRARSKKETQEDTSTRREDESRGEGDKPTRERTSEAARGGARGEEVRAGRGGQRKSHARALASVRNTRTRSSADAPENTRERGRGEAQTSHSSFSSFSSSPSARPSKPANTNTKPQKPTQELDSSLSLAIVPHHRIASASFLLSPLLACSFSPTIELSSKRRARHGRGRCAKARARDLELRGRRISR